MKRPNCSSLNKGRDSPVSGMGWLMKKSDTNARADIIKTRNPEDSGINWLQQGRSSFWCITLAFISTKTQKNSQPGTRRNTSIWKKNVFWTLGQICPSLQIFSLLLMLIFQDCPQKTVHLWESHSLVILLLKMSNKCIDLIWLFLLELQKLDPCFGRISTYY